jgi:putative RNA 2'-phosphotransferase
MFQGRWPEGAVMDRKMATRLSKFLSLVLRHRPSEYGLSMDDEGWIDFDDLVDIVVAEDILAENVEEEILQLVEESSRRRFEVANGRIRALYGHSAGVRLNLPQHDPPTTLYHGTTVAAARDIAANGLKPLGRAFVHLSATEEEARAVGSRHSDDPVILEIDTAAAREEGFAFHRATDLIWLCPALPPHLCRVPELPEPSAHDEPPVRHEVRARRPGPSAPEERAAPEAPSGFQRRTRKKAGR